MPASGERARGAALPDNSPCDPTPDPTAMHEPTSPPGPGAPPPGWQPLPPRAQALFIAGYLWLLVPAVVVGVMGGELLVERGLLGAGWHAAAGLSLAALVAAAWLGRKQYRYTHWLLDDEGLAVRRGRFWQAETRVPATRVQHLDVKRGPLQRRRALATLVVHTAGTGNSAVSVPNLAQEDAERLRERLSRQIDRDDD
jgi:uncharacterized protein